MCLNVIVKVNHDTSATFDVFLNRHTFVSMKHMRLSRCYDKSQTLVVMWLQHGITLGNSLRQNCLRANLAVGWLDRFCEHKVGHRYLGFNENTKCMGDVLMIVQICHANQFVCVCVVGYKEEVV